MGENDESLLKAIKHYQNNLDRYSEQKRDDKMLHCIEKLSRLPVKMTHLETTGVGRTVNALRKLEGKVGEAAKVLINQWKKMVVKEQEQQEEAEQKMEEDQGIGGSDDEDDKPKERSEDKKKSSHKSMTSKEKYEEKRKHSSSHKHKSKKNKYDDDSDSDEDNDKEKRNRHSKRDKDNDEIHENVHHRESHSNSSNSKHKSKKRNDSDKEEKPHKETIKSSNRESSHSHSKSKSKKKHHSDSNDEIESEKEDSQSNRHKRKRLDSDDEQKSKEKNKNKVDHKKHKSKNEENHKKVSSSSKQKISKEMENSKKDNKNSKSSNSKTDKEKRPKLNFTENGIDSGSGASFAEALGMCVPSTSKSISKPKKIYSEKSEKSFNKDKEKEKDKPNTFEENVPKPAIIDPVDINISSLLPPITPNYRPLGNIYTLDNINKKTYNEYDQLSNIMTSKNQRTKVYSGNRVTYDTVPTLFDLCLRVLQDNIDALEYTGGVPYTILKPILEKATPNQLFILEHHNPYLIDDTDELWQMHCQLDFKNKTREEMESWREMYMRCFYEREAKLKALTANIKQSQDKSLPVRTTKLAYVDDVAKPPRNVARKQAKNGTAFDKRPSVTPSSRLASLATSGDAGKVAVPNPGSRAVERSSNHAVKPKKAPLMAKSLSLLKNRFRR